MTIKIEIERREVNRHRSRYRARMGKYQGNWKDTHELAVISLMYVMMVDDFIRNQEEDQP